MTTLSDEDRRQLVNNMLDLHQEIEHAVITQPKMDPGRVMKLTALGVNQCLVALSALLTENLPEERPDAPGQLELFTDAG